MLSQSLASIGTLLSAQGYQLMGCSQDEIGRVVSSQDVSPPPEYIEFLEKFGRTQMKLPSAFRGLLFPDILQSADRAGALWEKYWERTPDLRDKFIIGSWEWSFEESHLCTVPEVWLVGYHLAGQVREPVLEWFRLTSEFSPPATCSLESVIRYLLNPKLI